MTLLSPPRSSPRTGRTGRTGRRRPHRGLARRAAALAATGLAATGLAASALVAPTAAGAAQAPGDGPFPQRVALPDGFQPEGIAVGRGFAAYFGSRLDGDLYRANLRTGTGRVISQGPGTPSVGLKVDEQNRIFVSGGTAGDARVVKAGSGEVLAGYQLVDVPADSDAAFINDVVLTDDTAWFTDSENAQLFGLPLDGGDLPDADEVVRLPLGGEWEQAEGLNANGITATPDGKALLVVNSASGGLFRVDPATGDATQVNLAGAELTNGDGMLLEGRRLYVVQNRLNQVAVLRVAAGGRNGTLQRTLTSGQFDVPTTIARLGDRLYLPNARFSTPPTPTTEYWVTRVAVPRG